MGGGISSNGTPGGDTVVAIFNDTLANATISTIDLEKRKFQKRLFDKLHTQKAWDMEKFSKDVVDQINSMISPTGGSQSIHDPLPEPFIKNKFNERGCAVDSVVLPKDYDVWSLTIASDIQKRMTQQPLKLPQIDDIWGDLHPEQKLKSKLTPQAMLNQWNYNKHGLDLIPFCAANQFASFKNKMEAMFGSDKVSCSQKVKIPSGKDSDLLWNEPSFLRMVFKQIYGDELVASQHREGNDATVLKQAVIYLPEKIKFRVKDLLRASIYVTNTGEIEKIIDQLQKTFKVKEIKNRLYDKDAAYAAVYVIFNFQGLLAELQLIAIESESDNEKKVRKKVCHTLYEIARSPSGPLGFLNQLGPWRWKDV